MYTYYRDNQKRHVHRSGVGVHMKISIRCLLACIGFVLVRCGGTYHNDTDFHSHPAIRANNHSTMPKRTAAAHRSIADDRVKSIQVNVNRAIRDGPQILTYPVTRLTAPFTHGASRRLLDTLTPGEAVAINLTSSVSTYKIAMAAPEVGVMCYRDDLDFRPVCNVLTSTMGTLVTGPTLVLSSKISTIAVLTMGSTTTGVVCYDEDYVYIMCAPIFLAGATLSMGNPIAIYEYGGRANGFHISMASGNAGILCILSPGSYNVCWVLSLTGNVLTKGPCTRGSGSTSYDNLAGQAGPRGQRYYY